MKELVKDDIYRFIETEAKMALYLYAPICGTCQLASQMLDITEKLVPELPMGKTDLNYLPELAEAFAVESVPCLLIFKDGKIAEKIYAFHSVPYLYDKCREV